MIITINNTKASKIECITNLKASPFIKAIILNPTNHLKVKGYKQIQITVILLQKEINNFKNRSQYMQDQ